MSYLRTVDSNRWKKFAVMVYRLYTSVFFLEKNRTSRKLLHFLNGSDIIPCSRNQAIPLPALQTFDCRHSVISHRTGIGKAVKRVGQSIGVSGEGVCHGEMSVRFQLLWYFSVD